MSKIPVYPHEKLQFIISEYQRKRKQFPDRHIEYVKSLNKDLKQVIVAATVSLDDRGEKHIHQYRMNNARLQKFARLLCEHEKEIASAKSFEELYGIISGIRIFGLGAALYYDIAIRIAQAKGDCLPDRIYLVRGALNGARNLGVDTKGKRSIERAELPGPLASSELSCAELADLLACFFAEGKWSDTLEFSD